MQLDLSQACLPCWTEYDMTRRHCVCVLVLVVTHFRWLFLASFDFVVREFAIVVYSRRMTVLASGGPRLSPMYLLRMFSLSLGT